LTRDFDINEHPVHLVKRFASAGFGDQLEFTYSRYEVAAPGHQATARRSPVLRVFAHDLTPDWLKDRLAELGPTEELAWHSWVERKGVGFHIPMIDFQGRPTGPKLSELECHLQAEMNLSFSFFETGRSFHGYSVSLIPEYAWTHYLGQLLLMNGNDGPTIVDTRWVGHALIRGFAALRWSHNTDRYHAMPRLLDR
jgi:hypothetical protein